MAQEGATVFLNTHNLTEAEKLCTQVGVIRNGKLLTVGNPDKLRMGVAIYLVLRAVPVQWFQGLSNTQILLIAILFLALLDTILLAISMISFHRSHERLNRNVGWRVFALHRIQPSNRL